MGNWTPGPWWPARVYGTVYIEAMLVSDDRLLQEVAACGPTATPSEQAANARLIAAAPMLLEALQSIVASLAEHDDEGMIEHADQMIAARTAITAATGEPK